MEFTKCQQVSILYSSNLVTNLSAIEDMQWQGQAADMSWWPKPNAWESSGLNVGYWSPDAERWFQMRLKAIRNGTAKLRRATEWKESMKLEKKSRDLTRANQTAAALFLSGHQFP